MKHVLALSCLAVLAVGLVLSFVRKARASGPTFTLIDPPGSVLTLAAGINDSSQIVGRYTDTARITHGFLLSNGRYTSFDYPGSTGFTRAFGINLAGQIVGDYTISNVEHGFLLSGGTFKTIDPPGAHGALAEGINSTGDIVGSYFADGSFNGNGQAHGFLLRGGVFTTIDFPGASYTEAWRITDSGQVIGRYHTGDGKFHVYVFSNGNFSSVPDLAGAVQTATLEVGGFNGDGDVAATYCSSTPCPWGFGGLTNSTGNLHGFLLRGGVYATIDLPEATVTTAFGLNSFGDVVGGYIDSNGGIHGYLRIP